MAIIQGTCTVFKTNLLKGLENFNTGSPYVYKIALYTATADLDQNTLVYQTTHEVVGVGYVAGGKVLTPTAPGSADSTAFVSFENVAWNSADFTARGGLIYNSTTNAAVAVLNFGSDKTTNNNFVVSFPPATAADAVIRII